MPRIHFFILFAIFGLSSISNACSSVDQDGGREHASADNLEKCIPEFKPTAEQMALLTEAAVQGGAQGAEGNPVTTAEIDQQLLEARAAAPSEENRLRIRRLEAMRIRAEGGPQIQVADANNKPRPGESYLTLEGVMEVYGSDPKKWPNVTIWHIDQNPPAPQVSRPEPPPTIAAAPVVAYNTPTVNLPAPAAPPAPSSPATPSHSSSVASSEPVVSPSEVSAANPPAPILPNKPPTQTVSAPAPVRPPPTQEEAASLEEQREQIRRWEQERREEEARREQQQRLDAERSELTTQLNRVNEEQRLVEEEIRVATERLNAIEAQPFWSLLVPGRLAIATDFFNQFGQYGRGNLNEELTRLNSQRRQLEGRANTIRTSLGRLN